MSDIKTSLPLPNLDDRRWAGLVEEGRALIPLYERQTWTDHNIHDPGIMVVELLAWLAEMDIYWLNRIPESHLVKFLALAGYHPRPPQPARALVQVLLKDRPNPLLLPAGIHLGGQGLNGTLTFRSLHPVTLTPVRLVSLQAKGTAGGLEVTPGRRRPDWTDLNARQARGESFLPFGEDPSPGAALYLGFDRPLPAGEPLTLAIYLDEPEAWAGEPARSALARAGDRHSAACRAPDPLVSCKEPLPATFAGFPDGCGTHSAGSGLESHHDVRLVWEILDHAGAWLPFEPQAGQVWDDTRAFTLHGRIVFRLHDLEMGAAKIGLDARPRYYLRCRLAGGAYDAAPRLRALVVNGIWVEQASAVGRQTWMITAGTEVTGPEPQRGGYTGFTFSLDENGWITALTFEPGGPPAARVLAYQAPQPGQPGRLSVEAELLKPGDGRPLQRLAASQTAVLPHGLRLDTWERNAPGDPGSWKTWELRSDLDASGRAGAHFVLRSEAGEIACGDGEHGRTLPPGALPLLQYRATAALEGNLPAGRIDTLLDDPHNRALLGALHPYQAALDRISNPWPAVGGAPAESLAAAVARAIDARTGPHTAATLEDVAVLAKATPGARLARAEAFPNLHPSYPCLHAPGVITLVVLPYLPAGRPRPSAGLLGRVRAYVASRTILGTTIQVVGPEYIPVAVRAQVQAAAGADPARVNERLVAALDAFFDPLTGGPEGTGWPFGRDIYRSEVLQVLDETPGVDHVLSLELLPGCEAGQAGCEASQAGCAASCANLCLGPLGLPAASGHQIEVLS